MSDKIIRINIDNFNNTGRIYPLQLTSAKNESFLEDAEKYQVVVEKLEVPVNGVQMPINNDDTPYTIAIFNESKLIPELPYGVNTYTFSGPFYSVTDFLNKVNDIVSKKHAAYTSLGNFIVVDRVIKFVRDTASDTDYEIFKMYFDERLMNLLTFNYDTTDKMTVGGVPVFRLKIVTTPIIPATVISVPQNTKTYNLFFTLKAIRVYTDLPTTPYKIFRMADKTMEDSNLLTEVIYNTVENFEERNLIYIPTVFRHTSLSNALSLESIRLDFRYKYANGEEIPIMIEPFQYSSITMAFYPIGKESDNYL